MSFASHGTFLVKLFSSLHAKQRILGVTYYTCSTYTGSFVNSMFKGNRHLRPFYSFCSWTCYHYCCGPSGISVCLSDWLRWTKKIPEHSFWTLEVFLLPHQRCYVNENGSCSFILDRRRGCCAELRLLSQCGDCDQSKCELSGKDARRCRTCRGAAEFNLVAGASFDLFLSIATVRGSLLMFKARCFSLTFTSSAKCLDSSLSLGIYGIF